MGCAAGSHRLGNASSFSQAGILHSGNTREQKSGRQSVAENTFSVVGDRMACTDHVVLLGRFSATVLGFSDACSGHGQGSAVSRRREMETRRHGRTRWGRTYLL
jgi:hypothetical protein